MVLKWIGAGIILISCGGFGLLTAAFHRHQVSTLKKLISVLCYMECELQFRMCALPELCRQAAMETDGCLKKVFTQLAIELEDQISPDVRRCMQSTLAKIKDIPHHTLICLHYLGDSMGRFDLQGQLKGLHTVRKECRSRLNALMKDEDIRLRSYQTLALCAGAAIVILLI